MSEQNLISGGSNNYPSWALHNYDRLQPATPLYTALKLTKLFLQPWTGLQSPPPGYRWAQERRKRQWGLGGQSEWRVLKPSGNSIAMGLVYLNLSTARRESYTSRGRLNARTKQIRVSGSIAKRTTSYNLVSEKLFWFDVQWVYDIAYDNFGMDKKLSFWHIHSSRKLNLNEKLSQTGEVAIQ